MNRRNRKPPEERLPELEAELDRLVARKEQLKNLSTTSASKEELKEVNYSIVVARSGISYQHLKMSKGDGELVSGRISQKDKYKPYSDPQKIDIAEGRLAKIEKELVTLRAERERLKTEAIQKQLKATEEGIFLKREKVPEELSKRIDCLRSQAYGYRRRCGNQ